MTSRFEEARQDETRQARLAAQTEALKRWLEKNHPEIRFGTALLKEFRENMLGAFFTADDADWEFALSMIDTRYLRQHVPTPEETKADSIDEISELLRSPDGTGRGGKYSDFNLKALRAQMQHWDISQLQARKDEVVRAQEMVKQPITELKQIVRDSRPARRSDGFPNLPDFIVMPGTVQAVKCDADFLLRLAKQDFYAYRRMVSRFGGNQISARQQGKS